MKNGVKYKKNLKINVNSILMICFLVVLFFFYLFVEFFCVDLFDMIFYFVLKFYMILIFLWRKLEFYLMMKYCLFEEKMKFYC